VAGDDVASMQHRWPATPLHCSAGGFIAAPAAGDEGFIVAPMKLHCSHGRAPTTRAALHCSPRRTSLERRRQWRMLLRNT
jgi:hypothetical protein